MPNKLIRNLRPIVLIARDVCRAATQEKMMYGFLLLALLFILMANVPFMVDDPKVFQNQPAAVSAVQIGFVSINIFTLLISVFISLSTLQNFLAKERLVLLLSKPVKRWQILEGVVLGLFEMVFMNWCLMTLGVWLVIVSQTRVLGFTVWAGMSVTALLGFLYVTLVVFFYCLIPNMMAGILAVLLIIAGFGATMAQDLFVGGTYPSLLKNAFLVGVNLLPKINELWGISMQTLGLFTLDIRAFPFFCHTLALCLALNLASVLKFRRFYQLL
jgi:hypothetical protein